MTTNGKHQGTPAPFHPPGRMPSLSSAVDAAQVMLRYQDLMERFLETAAQPHVRVSLGIR